MVTANSALHSLMKLPMRAHSESSYPGRDSIIEACDDENDVRKTAVDHAGFIR